MNFKTFFEQSQVKDGEYSGLQSGYEFVTHNRSVVLKTKNAVHGGKIVKHSLGDFLITG